MEKMKETERKRERRGERRGERERERKGEEEERIRIVNVRHQERWRKREKGRRRKN